MTTSVSPDKLRFLYRFMLLNRLLEERLVNLYRQGKMVGGLYRSLGQEATSVGAAAALADGDLLSPLIRNLGAVLVRGATPFDLLCQHLARAGSPSGGKDGTLHFSMPAKGLYAPISMLGTLVPVLAGMVLADRNLGKSTVALTFLGEGGTSTGAFHEGINLAAVLKLPLVVVLEFNRWAYSTPWERQCGAETLADKGPGYGVPATIVDGNDVLAVHEAVSRAVERARAGGGPALIESKTYRMKGHAEHDPQAYVDPAELAEWSRRDPIARFERTLDASGAVTAAERQAIHDEVVAELDAAVAAAEAQPFPEPDLSFSGVYADEAVLLGRRKDIWVGGLP